MIIKLEISAPTWQAIYKESTTFVFFFAKAKTLCVREAAKVVII